MYLVSFTVLLFFRIFVKIAGSIECFYTPRCHHSLQEMKVNFQTTFLVRSKVLISVRALNIFLWPNSFIEVVTHHSPCNKFAPRQNWVTKKPRGKKADFTVFAKRHQT